jgi:hypothetical protein|tara:strand:- start:71 stop:679 length:609 start_codon:yes stop_codon:yes gene_type:complete
MEVQPNLPQKAAVEVLLMMQQQLMVVLVEVLLKITLLVLLKLKLVNQAIVEHTDLEMMVALLHMLLIIPLAVEAVLALKVVIMMVIMVELVEQEKIIVQFLQTKEFQVGLLVEPAVLRITLALLEPAVLAEELQQLQMVALLDQQQEQQTQVAPLGQLEPATPEIRKLVLEVQALFVLRYLQQIIQAKQQVLQTNEQLEIIQ